MADYSQYNDASNAIKNLIENKEKEIKDIENQIFYLKKSIRALDEEFNKRISEQPNYLG